MGRCLGAFEVKQLRRRWRQRGHRKKEEALFLVPLNPPPNKIAKQRGRLCILTGQRIRARVVHRQVNVICPGRRTPRSIGALRVWQRHCFLHFNTVAPQAGSTRGSGREPNNSFYDLCVWKVPATFLNSQYKTLLSHDPYPYFKSSLCKAGNSDWGEEVPQGRPASGHVGEEPRTGATVLLTGAAAQRPACACPRPSRCRTVYNLPSCLKAGGLLR